MITNEKKQEIENLLIKEDFEEMYSKPGIWLKGRIPNMRMVDLNKTPIQVCLSNGIDRIDEGHGVQELNALKTQIENIVQNHNDKTAKGQLDAPISGEGVRTAPSSAASTEKTPAKKTKNIQCCDCGDVVSREAAESSFKKYECVMCSTCIDMRGGDNSSTVAVPISQEGQSLQEIVTQKNIIRYLCPDATLEEAYNFMQLCITRKLNPFLKEAYLIKYGNTPATMVVGKDAFTRKAEESGKLDGFEAGIIVELPQAGDATTLDDQRIGTFMRKDEKLLGGWAKVYRTDRGHPFEIRVSLSEYAKPGRNGKQNNWDIMPATMIRKIALVQALREAFTSELGGCYDSVELTEKLEQG